MFLVRLGRCKSDQEAFPYIAYPMQVSYAMLLHRYCFVKTGHKAASLALVSLQQQLPCAANQSWHLIATGFMAFTYALIAVSYQDIKPKHEANAVPGGRKRALASRGPWRATSTPVLDMAATYDANPAPAP